MLILFLLTTQLVAAQSIPLQNLSPGDYRSVARELVTNSSFVDVAGAGALGSPLSFEVGVVGGVTNTPRIDDLTRDAAVPRVPNAFAFARLALPLALTAEVGVLPRTGARGFNFENSAAALAWTPTELAFAAPFDFKVRAQLGTTSIHLNAVVDGARMDASFRSSGGVVEARASKNLGILTPFVGGGMQWADARMNATGALVFDPVFTRDQSERTYLRGGFVDLGLEAHLVVLVAGLAYRRVFDTDRFTVKLGFGF